MFRVCVPTVSRLVVKIVVIVSSSASSVSVFGIFFTNNSIRDEHSSHSSCQGNFTIRSYNRFTSGLYKSPIQSISGIKTNLLTSSAFR